MNGLAIRLLGVAGVLMAMWFWGYSVAATRAEEAAEQARQAAMAAAIKKGKENAEAIQEVERLAASSRQRRDDAARSDVDRLRYAIVNMPTDRPGACVAASSGNDQAGSGSDRSSTERTVTEPEQALIEAVSELRAAALKCSDGAALGAATLEKIER